jgi:K+-transporting ATPase A subunit
VSLILVAQGVPQTLGGPLAYKTVEGASATLYRGPVASLESIKHLGTNGGGFFAQNSAFPYENPSPVPDYVNGEAMAETMQVHVLADHRPIPLHQLRGPLLRYGEGAHRSRWYV